MVARRIIMGPCASLEGTNKDETGRKGIDILSACCADKPQQVKQ